MVEDQASDATPFTIGSAGDVTIGRSLIMTPSTAQNITAISDAILANASVVLINAGGPTLTSTPTIADGTDGQIVTLINVSTLNGMTLQDQKSVAGTNLRLSAAQIVLSPYDTITLVFSSTIGDWVQIAQSNNVGP